MQITKLEYQKKNPDRVNIFIDSKYSVSLRANEVISLGLHKGQEVTQDYLHKIIGESNFGKLLSFSLRFLAVRQRSKYEVVVYLKKQANKLKVEDDNQETLINMVVEKLVLLKMIDDQQFASWLVASRRGSKPKGKFAIEQELRNKGIDKEIVTSLLNTNDPEKSVSESQLAKRALEKKVKTLNLTNLGKMETYKQKGKLTRFLVSKGFEWEIASDAVEEIFTKE